MPASSRMDQPLASAKPISDGGSTSGITELRRGKKTLAAAFAAKEDMRNFADIEVSEEGRGGGGPGTGAEILLQPVVKAMMKQAVPLQPIEDDGDKRFHLQPMEDPMLEQVDASKEGCDPVEAHTGASSWQDLWTRGERSP
ncbi:hypothetical protein GRJ2_001486500 [Grus japonensis]|uniref:Uncharacterized protein n=1 Tax=Grus japonensis TaxID=30415 RepID=A0ABC9X0D7_GRUJA